MRINLFDFFDGWRDDSVELKPVEVPDAQRFQNQVLNRIEPQKKHRRPLLRGLMIAAIVMVLTITAVAVVGQYTIRQTEGMSYEIGDPHNPMEFPEANFIINFENVPDGNVVGFRLNDWPALEQEHCLTDTLSDGLSFLEEFYGITNTPEVPTDIITHLADEFWVGGLSDDSRKDIILQAAEEWAAEMSPEKQDNARRAAELYWNGVDMYMYTYDELEEMLAELFSPEELDSLIAVIRDADAETRGTPCLVNANIYSAAWVKDMDFLCYCPVEIVEESQINGRTALYFTSDKSDGSGVSQHILLYDAELGCVFHIGGDLSFEELERVVESLEIVKIDFPSEKYGDVIPYHLLDIAHG